MSPLSIAILSLGMSVDAFLASVSRGAGMHKPRIGEALKIGFVFGFVEMLTPLIGWAAGITASAYVEKVDHWIAFTLLGAVGLRMVIEAARRSDDADATQNKDKPKGRGGMAVLLMTAIGTSIDAMAVGVSLAFLDINIFIVAAAIGLATFLMSTGGIMMGRLVGNRFGRIAEAVGGIALIGLGASILYQHLAG